MAVRVGEVAAGAGLEQEGVGLEQERVGLEQERVGILRLVQEKVELL